MRVALCVLCLAAATTAFTWERQLEKRASMSKRDDGYWIWMPAHGYMPIPQVPVNPEIATEPTTETESESTQECGKDKFFCKSGVRKHWHRPTEGNCIPKSYRCDGKKIDCNLNEDELGCEGQYEDNHYKDRKCKNDEFKCPTGRHWPLSTNSHCIKKDDRCDGTNDCLGGEDEAECTNAEKYKERECDKEVEFFCPNKTLEPQLEYSDDIFSDDKYNSYCLNKGLKCDGKFDCYFGTDEEDCPDQATRMARKLADSADHAKDVGNISSSPFPVASDDEEERLVRELIEQLEARN